MAGEKIWNGTAWVDRSASPYTYTAPTGEVVGMSQTEYNAANNVGTEGLAANANQGLGSTVANWFTPQGAAGTSVGGNMMSALGTGIGAATGLAGLYYTKKNYDLQKDQQDYLKGREAQNDARKSQFAANVGGGASYNGVTSSVIK